MEKTLLLQTVGAEACGSVAELALKCDIVFTMLGYPDDVKEVILGEGGLIRHMKKGGIIVDMTTSRPSLAVELYEAGKAKEISVIDAPVSGGDVGAKSATLSIFCGGDSAVIQRIHPILSIMGTKITIAGDAGLGQHMKATNQILIATTMVGLCEGLLYAHRAGLDLDSTISALSQGAAGSWSLSNLGPRIVKRNFQPGFLVSHFIKDLKIAIDESARMKLELPGLALAKSLYENLESQGRGRIGTQALALALETLNGMHGKK